jgi:EF hand domain-containing protein
MKRLLAFTVAALLSGAAISQGQEMPPPSDQPPAATPPAPTQSTEPAAPGAQPATPGTQPTSPTSVFDALDADHDGKVGQQEAQAHPTVSEHFSKADANADGALSKEEFDSTFKSQ